MIDEIVVMYSITDDLLKAIAHPEDCRRLIPKMLSKSRFNRRLYGIAELIYD